MAGRGNGKGDLAEHVRALEKARKELEAAEVALAKAESEHGETVDHLAERLGLGRIDAATYEKSKLASAPTAALERVERARRTVASLGRAAGDLAEQQAEQKLAQALATVAALQTDEETQVQKLATTRELRAQADEQVALASAARARARLPFDDPLSPEQRQARDRSESDLIRWHVQNPNREVPAHLREKVAKAREQRKREVAAENERLREASRRSLAAAGFQGPDLEPGDAFQRLRG